MSIASDMIRGHTDTIILAQLMRGDSYGYKINRAIEMKTGGQYELKEGYALHSVPQTGADGMYYLLLG